jgi:hypothetical protein
MIDRRSFGLGAAAALAAGAAQAAADAPLFSSGPMAANRLAGLFVVPSAPVVLPDTPLVSAEGTRRLSQLPGRTWLVSLWAEWCAPCLVEATDLAAIARKHAGPSFGVVFVLTGSMKKLDLAAAQAVLVKRDAADAPLLVEPHGGNAVVKALGTRVYDAQMRAALKQDSGWGLPCNVLVDRHGRVRARSFGSPKMVVGPPQHPGPLTEADKARMLASDHTAWATPDGDAFATALAAGVLEPA